MKYNIFEKQENIEIRNAQIVYLKEVLQWSYEKIADFVGLAKSTIATYCRKFSNLLEKAKEWFGEQKEKIKEIFTKEENNIIFECEHHKGECAYIIEYFDKNKNFTFLKIGKTNDINRRIKEHIREYRKINIKYAEVKKIFYAEDEEDALTIENCLRKHYKKIDNCGFIKNDRFSNVFFNEKELLEDKECMKKIELFQK